MSDQFQRGKQWKCQACGWPMTAKQAEHAAKAGCPNCDATASAVRTVERCECGHAESQHNPRGRRACCECISKPYCNRYRPVAVSLSTVDG